MIAPADRLLRTVETIYEAAPDPLQWPRVLAEVADCFGDVGAILIWRKDDGSFGTIVSESLRAAQRDYIEQGWSRRDIKAIRAGEKGYFFNGEPFADRDICSEEEIRSDPFYTEFMADHGLGWIGSVAVSPAPDLGVALSVQRDARTKPQFTTAELEMLAMLGRHIERSLRLSIRLLDAQFASIGLGEALTRIGIGVFALDSLGRVVFANPAGQTSLGDALGLVEGRLQIRSLTARRKFDESIARMHDVDARALGFQPKPILVDCPESDRRLVIYLLPITPPLNSVEHFLTHTRAIALVIEQKANEPADPATVRDVLGITLGEARVAALIGSGLAPRAAAEKLGIAEETARGVLKRVFAKLGVSRQSELAALLSKLVLR